MLRWARNRLYRYRRKSKETFLYRIITSKLKKPQFQRQSTSENLRYSLQNGDLIIKDTIEHKIANVFSFAPTSADHLLYTQLDNHLNSKRVYSFSSKTGLDKLIFETTENLGFVDVFLATDKSAILQSNSSQSTISYSFMEPNSIVRLFSRPYLYRLDSFQGKYYLIGSKTIISCKHENTDDFTTLFEDKFGGINDCLFLEHYLVVSSFILPHSTVTILSYSGLPKTSFTKNGLLKLSRCSNFTGNKFSCTYSSPFVPNIIDEHDCNAPSKPNDTSLNTESHELVLIKTKIDNIPYTLFYSKRLKSDKTNPALVISYGAYGEILSPYEFRAEVLCLADIGFVVCFAHIRGGGEFGLDWYIAGTKEMKINSINDLEQICLELKSSVLVDPKKLSISTFSAGGLIVAALMNKRPNLFKFAILDSPFLNPYSLLADPNAKSGRLEREELGDNMEFIKLYDPMINLTKSNTSLLILGGLLDDRVDSNQLRQFSEKRRSTSPDAWTELILTNRGHFAKEFQDYENSVKLAFLTTEPRILFSF